ncbi:uncharacterized protein PTI45_00606 [Paenibacillus nuruki]|uniref:Nucleoside triphosphate pyrophosphohydrolase n=1 Tax=Paenibacillus nuruki TaxID=1886670 RepID=A0A1E3L840_9BACL|nr:nucleoside triphosphate pyrophosphohydrolase [Paenibacillus nuruki]ODP29987.1 uncharacterized protein PTI45_00606 [Paenibacillus nuruki]
MSAQITIVGLGSGDVDQLTVGIFRKLEQAEKLFVRTKDHPALEALQADFVTFDDVYESKNSFPEVYAEIANRLLQAAVEGLDTEEIIYAVPGHPMVAEKTVQILREQGQALNITVNVLGGESFLDEAFTRLGFDPIEGFQLLDAAQLNAQLLQLHTVIGQVYDTFTASDVKLSLMELYPDDFEVIVCHYLGVQSKEIIERTPVYELDRTENYGNLSLIYVPRTEDEQIRNRTFARLHEIVAILRSPGGCPWDQEQTHQSLRQNFIEETYEVLETIDDDDPEHMQEELGDVLLQIMLHAQIEEETGTFTVYDVIESLNQKLIFRHPHVFGDREANDAQTALQNWDAMKVEEKKLKGTLDVAASLLDGVPRDLPALLTAYKIQKKAAKVGFDWENIEGAFAKMDEEILELKEAVREGHSALDQQLELGDVLFCAVNIARFIDADPEQSLALVNRKFKQRFQYIEQSLHTQVKDIRSMTLEELDQLWDEAKLQNKG